MIKNDYANYKNESSDILHSTGYSNSRLGGQTLGKSHPKLSFDGMTIVKSLIKNIKIH